MKSYIYPKLVRDEMLPIYATNPAARYARVNSALVNTPMSILLGVGVRRERSDSKTPYEPFGVAITGDALRVLCDLPDHISISAVVQWILRH